MPYLSSTALIIAAGIVAFVLWRRPTGRSPARFAMFRALLFLGLSQILIQPPVYRAFDDLAGHNNTAILLCHSLGLAAWISSEQMFVHWTTAGREALRRAVRWRIAAVVAAMIVMVVAFFATPEVPTNPTSWRLSNITQPTVALYTLAFATIGNWLGFDLLRLSLRYAKLVSQPTRLGMWLFALGSAIAIPYHIIAVVDAIVGFSGRRLPEHNTLTYGLSVLSLMIVAIGAIVPGTGKGVIEAGRRTRQAWLCSRMVPLYAPLIGTWPDVAKSRPRFGVIGWVINWLGNGRKLTQRTIEIRDGLTQLRPWLADDVREVATHHGLRADLSAEELKVLCEAAQIADALRAKQRGDTPKQSGQLTLAIADEDEPAFLASVARTFDTSPLIDPILDDMDRRRAAAAGRPARRPKAAAGDPERA